MIVFLQNKNWRYCNRRYNTSKPYAKLFVHVKKITLVTAQILSCRTNPHGCYFDVSFLLGCDILQFPSPHLFLASLLYSVPTGLLTISTLLALYHWTFSSAQLAHLPWTWRLQVPEMLVSIYQTEWCHTPQDGTNASWNSARRRLLCRYYSSWLYWSCSMLRKIISQVLHRTCQWW